jgi:hypothetical protein
MTPLIAEYLVENLRGERSHGANREILSLVDSSEALTKEYNSTLQAIAAKIPGLSIDFDKLLSDDPIECDPLVAQGNLAILRLDALYYQAFQAWTKSGGDLHKHKSTTTPEDSSTYSDRKIKHERTDQNYPPDAQLLNQATSIVLAGFRVQATITHRRDQLASALASGGRKSPEFPTEASARAPSQPDALARAEPRKARFDEKINPMKPMGPFNGFEPLDDFSPPDSSPLSAPTASPRETPSTHPQYAAPDFNWNARLPPGLEDELDQEEFGEEDSIPTYSKPPFPSEKIHLYPPFAPASEEDAQEIEAYLSTLPEELRVAKTIGTLNDNLEAPLWRETESEYDWLKAHAKIHRQRAKQASAERNDSASAKRSDSASAERSDMASGGRKSPEEPQTNQSTECVPCSDCGTAQSEHENRANAAPHPPREEEPVTPDTNKVSLLSPLSAPPRDPSSLTSHQPRITRHFPPAPPFHKRE